MNSIALRHGILAIALTTLLAGCGSTPGERALSGGAIGAGVGATGSAILGGPVLGGAALGAAAGAATGALTDEDEIDFDGKKKR